MPDVNIVEGAAECFSFRGSNELACILNGIRLAGDERILGGIEFVEAILKHTGEVYERRKQIPYLGNDVT